MLRRRPLSLLASVGMGFVTVSLLGMLPTVGTLLAAIAAPATALGMIAACRAADAGQVPSIAQYVEGLKDVHARRQLLTLGLINAVIVLAMIALIRSLGLENALRVVQGPDQQPTVEAHPGLLAIRIALSTPVLMAMWLAPPMVGWHQLPAVKAMFFSFFACWRNRWPLLVFLAGTIGIGFAATLLLAGLAGLVGGDATSATVVIAPVSLALLALLQCGMFRMYRQIVQAEPS